MTNPRPDPKPPRASFPKSRRLLAPSAFDLVYRLRLSVSDELLILYARPNGTAETRVGLSVSRKVGNAVVRNRWKRLLREAFRLSQHELPAGLDLIAIPRGTASPELDELSRSMKALARRANQRARRN